MQQVAKAKRVLRHAEQYVYSQFVTERMELPSIKRQSLTDAVAILQSLRWEVEDRQAS